MVKLTDTWLATWAEMVKDIIGDEWDEEDYRETDVLMDYRDGLEKVKHSLNAPERERLREADERCIENAEVVFAELEKAFDIKEERVELDIPLSRWWWWLDKVAAGEIEPDLNGD